MIRLLEAGRFFAFRLYRAPFFLLSCISSALVFGELLEEVECAFFVEEEDGGGAFVLSVYLVLLRFLALPNTYLCLLFLRLR